MLESLFNKVGGLGLCLVSHQQVAFLSSFPKLQGILNLNHWRRNYNLIFRWQNLKGFLNEWFTSKKDVI